MYSYWYASYIKAKTLVQNQCIHMQYSSSHPTEVFFYLTINCYKGDLFYLSANYRSL